MLTNKLQTIWLELLDVNKQITNYMARTNVKNKLQWLYG